MTVNFQKLLLSLILITNYSKTKTLVIDVNGNLMNEEKTANESKSSLFSLLA